MKRLIKTLAVLATLGLLGVLSVVGMFFIISLDLPQINSLKDYNPPMNSRILSRSGEVLLDIGKETRDVVPYENIPPRVVAAFLSAEDDNFFNHEGIDYYGILRAFIVNLKEGRLVQGGSTITQQVAKSFLLTKDRTISRKIKDLLLARKIEQKFTKEEILYLYLNQVYLGGGYYGVKAAFKGYFDKELEEATPAEAALVAGLLVAPGRYSPYVSPVYAKRRQNYVLKRMFETGKINEEEYQLAMKEEIRMRIRIPNEMKGGHFTDWIRQEVMKSVGTEEFLTNGFTVVTTLDWDLQSKAEEVVKNRAKELDKRQGFRGAIRNLSSPEEIENFLIETRKRIMRANSSYFTFTPEGQNVFEFHEDDEAMAKSLSHYETEKSTINERLAGLVHIGISPTDPFLEFLKPETSYEGVVLDVDDLKRIILVSVGGTRVMIPQSGFEWAHERKFSDTPYYFAPVRNPTRIVKKGDVILVKIEKKPVPSDQLINENFFKRYTDKNLRNILAKQKFFQGSLDQEPEVEAALFAIDSNKGEIITLVGGVDFKKSQFNRVIQSSRQAGSAFKPFIYAAGLENGYNPSSILMDTPQALGGVDNTLNWKPRNYDGEFVGPLTFRRALEISRNVPTIRLVQDLGVDKMLDFTQRLHMNAEIQKDMSLSLGSFGISLAELTKGFAVFANGGRAVRLSHILSIKDRSGKSYPIPAADPDWKETETKKPEVVTTEAVDEEGAMVPVAVNPFLEKLNSVQVYDQRLAYIMANLLMGVTHYGTAASVGTISPNIGGKTGTTNNYVDALFVGFTPTIVVGTWTGFDDNRPLGYGETGTRSALPMWADYMKEAISKYGAPDFPVPEGIDFLMVNKETGKELPEGAAGGFMEAFVSGYGPGTRPETFDQTAQQPGVDDDGYFQNQ